MRQLGRSRRKLEVAFEVDLWAVRYVVGRRIKLVQKSAAYGL
jgi:hypothetical protein